MSDLIDSLPDEASELRKRYNELAAAVWVSTQELLALVRSAKSPQAVASKPVLEIAQRLQTLVAHRKPNSGD